MPFWASGWDASWSFPFGCFLACPTGRRLQGRPRTRWIDDIYIHQRPNLGQAEDNGWMDILTLMDALKAEWVGTWKSEIKLLTFRLSDVCSSFWRASVINRLAMKVISWNLQADCNQLLKLTLDQHLTPSSDRPLFKRPEAVDTKKLNHISPTQLWC